MQIGLLSVEQLVQWWPAVEQQMLAAPAALGNASPQQLVARALAGTMQVWVLVGDDGMVQATVFSEISDQPRGKVCRLVGAWGQGVEEFLPALPTAIQTAAGILGINVIEVAGRPGWAKLLRPYGFRVDSVTLSLQLERTLH